MGGKQVWAKNKVDIGNLDTARLVFATEGTYHDGQLISTFSGLKYADTDSDGNFTPPSGLTSGNVYEIAVFPLAGDTKRVQKIIGGWTYELPEGENIHELTELNAAPASGDELLIYDADAAAQKKITADNLLSDVNSSIGTLASLSTTVKTDLVSAINEVDGAKPDAVGTSVTGNLVSFSGTTGQLADSGAKPADFEPADAAIQSHIGTVTGNPHNVTYTEAGAEPANANIQSHISAVTGNPHAVTAAEAGAPELVNPSVADNFVAFSDVAGGQKDSGLSKNDLGMLIVNPSVADNFPAFNDAAGAFKDSGYGPDSFEPLLPAFAGRNLVQAVTGKATTHIFNADSPADFDVLGGFVWLDEAPDNPGATYTVKLTNGTDDVSDTLTFTEGVEAAGAIKAFTIVPAKKSIAKNGTLDVVTSGTTTTLGKLHVYLFAGLT